MKNETENNMVSMSKVYDLWWEVLFLWVSDSLYWKEIKSGNRHAGRDKIDVLKPRQEAYEWISADDEGFRVVCEFVGIRSESVREYVLGPGTLAGFKAAIKRKVKNDA